ncbi:MAG: DUF2254 domain-containing protein, partial [Oleibacter sp.]|nr:DUF2254 domain-containing protein [Thalassolituus sp.]
MLSKWQWLLSQLTRTLSLRVFLFALLAVATALIALPLQNLTDEPLPLSVASGSVDSILKILATSMLTVTTFSLSVMVSAYAAASSSATPRATRLVQEDPTTHNVLGTFIGSFLFSLVGIISLSMGIFNENGRLILFLVTIGMVILIVATLLRWIEHLSSLGRISETTDRVEEATTKAIKLRVKYPHLGGKRLDLKALPEYVDDESCLFSPKTGYIQHVDMAALNDLGKKHEIEIAVLKSPGSFVHPAEAIAAYSGDKNEELEDCILATFTIDSRRSFDQDPRFGLEVMTEIASRALSPAVNDPGTAIDVLSRSVRLLYIWKDHKFLEDDSDQIEFPFVRVLAIETEDLFEDIYMP